MKILQINSVYQEGSTGKIVYEIHRGLNTFGFESVVCYGRGKKRREKNVYKICSEIEGKSNALLRRLTGLMYGGSFFSTKKLISVIKKEKPNVVHLHCLNGNFVNIYKIIEWLKKNRIKTVLTLHAEFMYTANCGYAFDCEKWQTGCGECPRLKVETKSYFGDRTHISWKKMKASFQEFKTLNVVSVSGWLMDRAKRSPILADKKQEVVLNGLDSRIFTYRTTDELRKKKGITNEKIIFHATPLFNNNPSHIKGGYYVLEIAKKMLDQNVKFFVAGSFSSDLRVPPNIILLGQIRDQKELANYYAMADVTLLTSKKETFSMVVAESLSCGTPVVGFKAGAPETIALREYSEFVEYGNVDELQVVLEKWLNQTDVDKQKISEEAKAVYDSKRMIEGYLSIYRKMNKGGMFDYDDAR